MLDFAPPELILVLISLTFVTTLWTSAINCASKKQTPAPVVTPNVPKASELKPQVIPKNEKEEMIARGQLKRGRNDYPTMDDVCSDWETEREGAEADKKKAPVKPKTKLSVPSGEPKTEGGKPEEKPKTEGADGDEKSKAADPAAK